MENEKLKRKLETDGQEKIKLSEEIDSLKQQLNSANRQNERSSKQVKRVASSEILNGHTQKVIYLILQFLNHNLSFHFRMISTCATRKSHIITRCNVLTPIIIMILIHHQTMNNKHRWNRTFNLWFMHVSVTMKIVNFHHVRR